MRRLAPALAALALAACGGGELSRQQFLERADAICTRVNDELSEIQQPASLAELAPVLDEGLVVVRDAVEDLRELEPPAEMEARVEAWIDKVDEAADELDKAADAARRGDQEAVGLALQAGDDANTEGNERARQLGLQSCAVG